MSEAKKETQYEVVTLTDGREVQFAGKRKVLKETLIDNSKVETAEGVIQVRDGAIALRMDFRNGETRTIQLPLSLLLQFAGHGAEQKFGDELASPSDKPMSPEDMVCAIDDLAHQIAAGNWGKARAAGGGSVSGAHVVIQAICEATGKDLETVKAFLQKKLDSDPNLSRRALYDSFRAEGTKTGAIIARIEAEKGKKTAAVDADAVLGEL